MRFRRRSHIAEGKGLTMSKTLDLSKTVHDLGEEYPEFIDVMVGLGFTPLANPDMRNSVGRMMTVPKGCAMHDVKLEDAIKAFEDAGFTVINASGEVSDKEKRAKLLESYVSRLSAGEPLESVRKDFVANFSDVDAAEIARAEQNLIEAGAKISDVQRLCDVHSALFHGATHAIQVETTSDSGEVEQSEDLKFDSTPFKTPGHPLRVFALENEAIERQIARTRKALDADEGAAGSATSGPAANTPNAANITGELRTLSTLGIHYSKKGDLLYPVLKLNHDFGGPYDVMWGVDDEIRAELGALIKADTHDDEWHARVDKVLTRADEMVYKESNILLPLCARTFNKDEWLQIYEDMKGYDLCFIDDAGTWDQGEAYCKKHLANAQKASGVIPLAAQLSGVSGSSADSENSAAFANGAVAGNIQLPSGNMTESQLDAMLNTLPFEITFIDANETNRYWNDNGEKKFFKRPAAALGRKVWDCHPPKVQPIVRQVITALKNGQKSVDVWLEKEGQPVLVRYMAVRDREGSYLGTMEVVQHMGFAKEHFNK